MARDHETTQREAPQPRQRDAAVDEGAEDALVVVKPRDAGLGVVLERMDMCRSRVTIPETLARQRDWG